MPEQDPSLEIEKYISTPEGKSMFITEIACHIVDMTYPGYDEGNYKETAGDDMLDEAETLENFLANIPSIQMLKDFCEYFRTKSGKKLNFPDEDALKILKQQANDRYRNPEIPKP